MQWHNHSTDVPIGAHAVYGGSKYSWVNDSSPEDALSRYYSSYASEVGTRIHELAADCIKTSVRLNKSEAKKLIQLKLLTGKFEIPRAAFDEVTLATNLINFINDGIGYGMRPEQVLKFSDYSFGTADAIIFDDKTRLLRIHDLKTGVVPAKFIQLEIYAAYFCLEYALKPGAISIELRIYQNGDVLVETPTAEDITPIIDSTLWHNKLIQETK